MPTTSAMGIRKTNSADSADSETLAALFARVTMDSDVVLSIDRHPDFHALYRLQSNDWECWAAEVDNEIRGMATLLVRPGYIAGRQAAVGYLGDLRAAPGSRAAPLLGEFYGSLLENMAQRTGAAVFLTSVIASNAMAIRALTGPGAARRGIPPYTLLSRFRIRSVHATLARIPRRTGYFVRRATTSDTAALATFLDADGRDRPYGHVFAGGELQRRLATWPELCIEDFLMAEDKSGDLVGCLAVWDPVAVKRTRVTAYRGRMGKVQRHYNRAARLLRFTPLPSVGATLPYSYVTHLAIPSQDPAVMAALLDVAYQSIRRTNQCFLSAFVLDDDPLSSAYRGFVTTDLEAHLYGVTPIGNPIPHALGRFERPGFEMALV